MFTLLADAMFTATLNERHRDALHKRDGHADHYIPKRRRSPDWQARTHHPYRDLW